MAKKNPAAKPTTPDTQSAKKAHATGSASAGAANKKTASAPARKAPVNVKKSGAAPAPVINTSLAATAAASMIANKTAQPSNEVPRGARKESPAFKQLKAGLNKPAAAPLGGAFAVPQPTKKSPLPFGGAKQVGHNQTFGADVNRAGVPRRTPG